MVEITLGSANSGSELTEIGVRGHAAFSNPEVGGDIVCSAVSALVGYLGITFSEFLPEFGEVKADDLSLIHI